MRAIRQKPLFRPGTNRWNVCFPFLCYPGLKAWSHKVAGVSYRKGAGGAMAGTGQNGTPGKNRRQYFAIIRGKPPNMKRAAFAAPDYHQL
jgi:hypothetical protein